MTDPGVATGARRARAWVFRLFAVGGSVLMALLMVEGFLRVRELIRRESPTASSFDNAIYDFDPARHHHLVPNGRYRHTSYEFDYVWTNNGFGMRDRPHDPHKAPGTFRILFLGDSFVQGHGVSLRDTMVRHLESNLNKPGRPNIEILNAGVFGYSPMLESVYLRDLITPFQPDLVIVGLFLGNDIGEDYFYTQKAHFFPDGESFWFDDHRWPWSAIVAALDGEAAGPNTERGVGAAASAGPWLAIKDTLRQSRALALLKSRLDARSYPQQREREFALVRDRRGDIRYDLGLVNYPVGRKEDRLAYWATSLRYLEKIATLCRDHGARMALLVIPPVERLNGETTFDEPYEIIGDFAQHLSIPVINLLPDFLAADPNALYYRFDRHWTPEGQQKAAEVVERELHRSHLLPGDA